MGALDPVKFRENRRSKCYQHLVFLARPGAKPYTSTRFATNVPFG
jgi:hypothetical protein